MKSILVVCIGNICRSPMAQGLLADALPGMQVRSAGLGALVGMPADPTAVRLMQDRGIDISEHRALQLTRQMCLDSEIVLVMDTEQRQNVEELYPQSKGRVFRLGEFSKRDIPDPYRKSEAAFRASFSLIDESVRDWIERIKRL
jgi:protein-tyrosine phosphatase